MESRGCRCGAAALSGILVVVAIVGLQHARPHGTVALRAHFPVRALSAEAEPHFGHRSFRQEEIAAFRKLDALEHDLGSFTQAHAHQRWGDTRHSPLSAAQRVRSSLQSYRQRSGAAKLVRPASAAVKVTSLSGSAVAGEDDPAELGDNVTAGASNATDTTADNATSSNASNVTETSEPTAVEANTYVSPASLGEEGAAAFHAMIAQHDNYTVAASHASQVAARKSNHLVLKTNGSNGTDAIEYWDSFFAAATPNVSDTDEDARRIFNTTDNSTWFLPRLKPLAAHLPLGLRGFSSHLPDPGGAAAAGIAAAGKGEASRWQHDIAEADEPESKPLPALPPLDPVSAEGEEDGVAGAQRSGSVASPQVHVHVERREFRGDDSADDDIWILDKRYDMRHGEGARDSEVKPDESGDSPAWPLSDAASHRGASAGEGHGEVSVQVTLPLQRFLKTLKDTQT